jgi:uncharacterized DUF497 family protein
MGWLHGRPEYRLPRTTFKIEERLFAVAYTPRGTVIRLISARKANEREQRKYDETLST